LPQPEGPAMEIYVPFFDLEVDLRSGESHFVCVEDFLYAFHFDDVLGCRPVSFVLNQFVF